MPLIIEWEGYKFFFYKSEVLFEPAHVHVKGHGGNMKIWLADCKEARPISNSIPKHKKTKILTYVKDNLTLFQQAWKDAEKDAGIKN